jgi:capsular exopolysaccharide synthesis family protein
MSKLFEALRRASLDAKGPGVSTIPALATPAAPTPQARPAALTSRIPAAGVRSVSVHLTEAAVLPFEGAASSVSEQYRMIRTKLLYALNWTEQQAAIVLVSSASPGDGKTVTAINIAGALALKNDSNILIVDGDLVRASLAKKLDLPQSPGLAEVLQGTANLESALVRIQEIPNLYVLPAGKAGEKRTELLDSVRWKELCAVFRREFPFTIIDAPPIAAVADYDVLQTASDGVVMVVRPDHTDRGLCMQGIKSIPKEKLLGVVWNAADASTMASNYGYYYTYKSYSDEGKKTAAG